ncbi:DUF721 domain-containing protein [Aeromicrobium sp.]|uniref:DUF721 domain-containing protein n=1 Tax=Aeromicrobium sp. TaxID=1871063 RepID=UPI003C390890
MTEPDEPIKPEDGLGLARDIANSYRGKASAVPPSGKRRVRPAKPSRDKRDEPSPLSDLLGQVVSEQGWEGKLSDQRIFTDWTALVGPEVAQHAQVEAYEDGEVHVRAASTAWATQLKMLAPRIVAKLNEQLGDGTVLRIIVRGPQAPSWKKGPRSIRGARGPRDTYG